MTGDKILSHIVDNEYALDIDDYNDLKIMRAKFKSLRPSWNKSQNPYNYLILKWKNN